MIRALQWSALALAFIVITMSSSLRLAANGLSCTPWPACYGQPATAAAAQFATSAAAMRAIHRVAATVFGLLALTLALRGWRRFTAGERGAALLLLAITLALAWIGRHTPSPLPAVTVANVLGGLALIGLPAWMLAGRADAGGRGALPALLAVALVLQAAGGALISARLAGTACAQPCEHVWLPGAAALWDLGRAGSAVDLLGNRFAGQPLYATHALLGMALLPAAFVVTAAHRGRAGHRLLLAIGAAVAAGLMLHVFGSPLPLAVLHAVLAAVVTALLAALVKAHREVAMQSRR